MPKYAHKVSPTARVYVVEDATRSVQFVDGEYETDDKVEVEALDANPNVEKVTGGRRRPAGDTDD